MPAVETVQTELIPHLKTTDLQFNRILVSIDFSEYTHQVLAAATQIANIFGSKLFMVNAVIPALLWNGRGAD